MKLHDKPLTPEQDRALWIEQRLEPLPRKGRTKTAIEARKRQRLLLAAKYDHMTQHGPSLSRVEGKGLNERQRATWRGPKWA